MFSWILVHTVIPAPGDGGEGNIDENGNKDDDNCLHQDIGNQGLVNDGDDDCLLEGSHL